MLGLTHRARPNVRSHNRGATEIIVDGKDQFADELLHIVNAFAVQNERHNRIENQTFGVDAPNLFGQILDDFGGVNRVVDRDVLKQSKLIGYGYYTSTTTCWRGDLQDRTCALLFNKK